MEPKSHTNRATHRSGMAILIVVFFFIGLGVPQVLNGFESYRAMRGSWPIDAQFMIHPLFRMLIVLIGWLAIRRLIGQGRTPTLGIMVGWRQALKGFVIGFACTLPMLVLGLMCTTQPASRYLVYSTVVPGFTEEVFYRAFAFGLLVQVVAINRWTAAVFTAIFFGLAHVDFTPSQGQTILGQFGPWIAMIALGGLLYAWIYQRANWNLWVVVALHAGMNLWWDVFDLTSSEMGNWGATISRILAVGLAIYFVVFRGVLRPPATNQVSTIRA